MQRLEVSAAVRHIYRVSQEEWTKHRESVSYVKLQRYNPKHLYPKFSNLFLLQNSTCFLPIIRSLVLYTQQQLYVVQGLLTTCQRDQNPARKQYDIYLLLCIQYQTPDDGQKTCAKHVEFYSKNKFEKLVHFIGFIIRIYHDARSSECQRPKQIF